MVLGDRMGEQCTVEVGGWAVYGWLAGGCPGGWYTTVVDGCIVVGLLQCDWPRVQCAGLRGGCTGIEFVALPPS